MWLQTVLSGGTPNVHWEGDPRFPQEKTLPLAKSLTFITEMPQPSFGAT
jgi:hypothetical protein